jgi:hypothetical protein
VHRPSDPNRERKKKNEGIRIWDEDLEKVIKAKEQAYHIYLEK